MSKQYHMPKYLKRKEFEERLKEQYKTNNKVIYDREYQLEEMVKIYNKNPDGMIEELRKADKEELFYMYNNLNITLQKIIYYKTNREKYIEKIIKLIKVYNINK